MPQDPVTWQATATLVGLLFTGALLLVNIRAQFRAAQEQIDRRFAEAQTRSDERARRTYEKIDDLRDETARTYVRRDVYDADHRHDAGAAEEAMRMAQDVAGRLNCPVRPAE